MRPIRHRGAHRLLEDLRSHLYDDPEILERVRDHAQEAKSDQHPDDDRPAQNRRMDPVRAFTALAEEIIGVAEGPHGRRSIADGTRTRHQVLSR